MKRAHREGQWRFPKSKDFLKQYPFFAAMRNKLWSLTWYADIGASLVDPRFSIQYIGRYTKRAVMAAYRIVYYDGKIVRFSYKDYANGAKTRYMTLKVYTFIGRLIRHIADKHFAMIRSAGLFSNRWKKQYSCSTLLNVSVANAAFLIKDGVSHDVVSCALKSFSTSKRDNHLSGNAMIATKGWSSRVFISAFMEKQ